jgi:predicted CopG family antitoxin
MLKGYSMSQRNTITIRNNVYTRLRSRGKFGESFSSLIDRILDEVEGGKGKV